MLYLQNLPTTPSHYLAKKFPSDVVSAAFPLIRMIDVPSRAIEARISTAHHEIPVYPHATTFTIPGLYRLKEYLDSSRRHVETDLSHPGAAVSTL